MATHKILHCCLVLSIGNAGPRIAAGQLGYANPDTAIVIDDTNTDSEVDDSNSGTSGGLLFALVSVLASTMMPWISIAVM